MKKYTLLLVLFLCQAPALALDVYLNSPPDNYNIYDWNGRSIRRSGSSSQVHGTFKFTIPDEYVVSNGGDTPDLARSLENWRRSTPVASGNPRTVSGVGYFPFTDENGNQHYIALEHLRRRMHHYNGTTLSHNANTNTETPAQTKTATASPHVDYSNTTSDQMAEEIGLEKPSTTATAEIPKACKDEKSTLDKWRGRGSSAPNSTKALIRCLQNAGHNDLAQAAREEEKAILYKGLDPKSTVSTDLSVYMDNNDDSANAEAAEAEDDSSNSDDNIIGTAEAQAASAEQLGLCTDEKEKVDHYRAQGSSAPKSTEAYAKCLENAGRSDLAQTARQARLDFLKSDDHEPPTSGPGWNDPSKEGAIKKLEAWQRANIRALNCGNADLRDTATCAVCNCVNEAGTDNDVGKVMVNRVAMARMKWRNGPNTLCGAISYKPRGGAYWFSWLYESFRDRRATGKQLRQCVAASITALKAGPSEADHYHATYINPSWAKTCRIAYGKVGGGKHKYFKGPCIKGYRGQRSGSHDVITIGR